MSDDDNTSDTTSHVDTRLQQLKQEVANQTSAVAMAQRLAQDILAMMHAVGSSGDNFTQAEAISDACLQHLTANGVPRMVTLTALASVLATIVHDINEGSSAEGGIVASTDVLIMVVGMLAQHTINVYLAEQARAASAPTDASNAH